jgi:hypothetical protein
MSPFPPIIFKGLMDETLCERHKNGNKNARTGKIFFMVNCKNYMAIIGFFLNILSIAFGLGIKKRPPFQATFLMLI